MGTIIKTKYLTVFRAYPPEGKYPTMHPQPWFSLGLHIDFKKHYIDIHFWWWLIHVGREYDRICENDELASLLSDLWENTQLISDKLWDMYESGNLNKEIINRLRAKVTTEKI